MRRLLQVLLALVGLTVPAAATWSIVVVDTRTGEVGVASATCIPDFDLRQALPILRVGRGAGAAQSAVDVNAINRRVMWDGFRDGLDGAAILELIRTSDAGGFQNRQFGIVSIVGDPLTFSGGRTGEASLGRSGTVGTLKYAIQGNVLAGNEVVFAAEAAFLATDGDMGQRMMAAMEAARAAGGDGRCSCGNADPTACGAPPVSFTKTADVGHITIARRGDRNGVCAGTPGCANGDYYLNINVVGARTHPDPVFTLFDEYADWRASLSGRPDHLLSELRLSAQTLPADGVTSLRATVRMVDLDGVPLTGGGLPLTAGFVGGDTDVARVGPITDHGDGRYSFDVTAGTAVGEARLDVRFEDARGRVVLSPRPTIVTEVPRPLHCGVQAIGAEALGTWARVPFVIDVPEARDAFYLLLASDAGTDPGLPLVLGLTLPLNDSGLLKSTWTLAQLGYPDTTGRLDASGRAEASVRTPPRLLLLYAGLRIDWAAVLFGDELRVTNAAGFTVGN